MFGSKRKKEKLTDDVLSKAMWDVGQWIEDYAKNSDFEDRLDATAISTSTSALVAAAYALPLSILKEEGRPYKQIAQPYIDAASRLFKGVAQGVELVYQGEPDVKANLSSAEAKERLQKTYMLQTNKMENYTKGYMDFIKKGPGRGSGVLLCESVTLDVFGESTFDPLLALNFIGLSNKIPQQLC